MNVKVKKIVQATAAALFLIALVINIKVTLDDPFQMVSEQALATGTDGTSSGEACWSTITSKEASQVFYCGSCSWISGTYSWNSGKSTCTPK